MDLTILDLEKMLAAYGRAMAHLLAARRELAPYLVVLNAQQRKEQVKAPLRLNKVGREMVAASEAYPRLVAACPRFDGPFVLNRLESAEIIAPFANQAEALARMAEDTYQTWMSQAFTSTLQLYRVGKELAEDDPSLQVVIQPMAEVFAARKAKKEETSSGDGTSERGRYRSQ